MARNRLILLSSFTVTCGIVCKVIRDEIRLANRRKKTYVLSKATTFTVWGVVCDERRRPTVKLRNENR